MDIKEEVCSFDNLYKAMYKCRRNVGWKDSVAGFVNKGLINCTKLRDKLLDGTYTINKYTIFQIHEPKEREIVSTRIKDRVFQRSLCDNYLTQEISKSFIYDNCACQVNKGTKFARDRLKAHMQKFYRKHELDGYVLKCDISNYFGSTDHEVAIAAVKKRVGDPWVVEEVSKIINSFNNGPDPTVGMGLGSQVTQLIELAVLDDLDHYIKEQLHIKHYIRYMDDFILIHESKEYLIFCREQIRTKLQELHLTLSKKKTQIFPIEQSIHFLGFRFVLTKTGKVLMLLNHEKISHERRKLCRLVNRMNLGLISREHTDKCFESWKAHANQGNSSHLIHSMTLFYQNLWR